MQGTVRIVNTKSGRIAVETDLGVSVVEILDTLVEVDVDDVVAGQLDECGPVTLLDVTTAERFDAFVQAVGASLGAARTMLRLDR